MSEINGETIQMIAKSEHAKKAMSLFKSGCNCAQAVFTAFDDMYDMDKSTALKLSSVFGGGIGRMRETCGAAVGAFMVIGMLYGYDDTKDNEAKKELYRKIQELAGEIKEQNGSIICKELLGLDKAPSGYEPDPRSPQYYAKRPCAEIVGTAAALLEEYIKLQK